MSIEEEEMSEFENEKEELEYKLFQKLGFCGCGLPDEALSAIHEVLKLIKYRTDSFNSCSALDGEEWSKLTKTIEDYEGKLFKEHQEGILYILYYLLDDKGIINHGGSVPGWVEDEQFYKDISQWRKLYLKGLENE